MAIEKALYTAHATSTGGREGKTASSDGALNVALSTPKELGGAGGPGTNPEQLFAAGYSACFIGAMKAVSARQKIALPAEVSISSSVSIGPMAGKPGAFGIAVDMKISVPAWSAPPWKPWWPRPTRSARTRTPRVATSTSR